MSSTYFPDASNTTRYFDMIKKLQLKIVQALPMWYIGVARAALFLMVLTRPLITRVSKPFLGRPLLCKGFDYKARVFLETESPRLRFCGGVV